MRHNYGTHCAPPIQKLLKTPSRHFLSHQAASGMEKLSIIFCARNFRRSILLILSLGITYGLLGCGGNSQGSSTSGTPILAITATSGTGQTAAVGAAFGTQLQATVTTNGSPASGMIVTFSAPASGASGAFATTPPSATATATTNSSGVATAPAFTAGKATGTYTVNATAAGSSTPADFSLTNTTGPATKISVASGSGQTATVGTTFGTSLVATVLDIDSNPVGGATVTFTAPSSGASGMFATTPPSATATATTTSSGVATAPSFTADAAAGAYTVTATVSGAPTPADFVLTNIAPTPPTLTPGNYVFSLSGANPTYSYSVAGAFTVAVGGVINGGEQDFVGVNPTFTPTAFSDPILNSSTYAVSADGNLTITLVTGDTQIGVNGNGTEILKATLFSAQGALITEFDASATASGSMALQSNPSTPVGGYAFYLSGQDFYQPNTGGHRAAAAVMGGILNFDGSGGISIGSSVFDVNESVTPDFLDQIFLSGSVSTTPDSFGRITISLTPNDYSTSDTQTIVLIGYIVDSGSIRLVETTDPNDGTLGGVALAQTATLTNSSLSGSSYIFGMSGVIVTQSIETEPMQLAGVLTFTADPGSTTTGTVAGTLSYNDFTGDTPQGGSVFTGTYTLDATHNGRISVASEITDAEDSPFGFLLQFYLTGDGRALIIAVDYSVIGGVGFQQSGSFSAASFGGSYAVNVRQSLALSYTEYDGVGPATADGIGTLSGFVDLNGVSPSPDVTLSGNFAANTNGVFTGSITGLDTGAAANPDNFTFYVGDSSHIFAIETDSYPNQLTLAYFQKQ